MSPPTLCMYPPTCDTEPLDKQEHVFQGRRKEIVTKLLEKIIFHKFNNVQYCTFTVHHYYLYNINPLKTKLYLSDLKIQFVPRSKHSLPRL